MNTRVVDRLRRPDTLATALTAGVGSAALTTLYLVDPSERMVFFPCPFRLVTGLDCPLCGGLRMVHSVLHGEFAAAADYNALALAGLPLLAVVLLRSLVRTLRGRAVRDRRIPRWVAPTVAAVLITWTVLRNLPLEPFTILRS
ncbi:MAG: DUF2752 domain-containing protein [Haloechinothrix sp.]